MHELTRKVDQLTRKPINLQYSGFIIFAAKILSIATGLVFQLMIARATSAPGHEPEYDLWFNMNDLLAYFTLLAAVVPFWVMRFVAREKEGAIKTGIITNLAISVVAILVYLPLVPVITSALGISGNYLLPYFLLSIQILDLYSVTVLESCLQARAPQIIGYGLLVQQVFKVVLGYVLIIQLQQPLLGAVLVTVIAFLVQIAYYFKILAEELRQRVRWDYVKEWFRGSLANIYNVAGSQISVYIFIMLFTYGGEGARGRYGAAVLIANVITYSSFLAFALYPKLIAERKPEDITTSLKMVLMFAIPMTAEAIALSDSYIVMLKEALYSDAGPVLIAVAIDMFISTVSGIFIYVLYGLETVDAKARISFRELAKSRLFIAFSLPYLHSAITLPAAFYFLTTSIQNQPMLAALYVGIINASARMLMFFVLYAIVRKMIRINIPWRNISKYSFASIVTAVVLFVIPHQTRLSLILAVTAIGGLLYVAILMAIDKEVRVLSKTAIQMIKDRVLRWKT